MTPRDYITSIRDTLATAEQELGDLADELPGVELGSLLAQMRWEAERVKVIAMFLRMGEVSCA